MAALQLVDRVMAKLGSLGEATSERIVTALTACPQRALMYVPIFVTRYAIGRELVKTAHWIGVTGATAT